MKSHKVQVVAGHEIGVDVACGKCLSVVSLLVTGLDQRPIPVAERVPEKRGTYLAMHASGVWFVTVFDGISFLSATTFLDLMYTGMDAFGVLSKIPPEDQRFMAFDGALVTHWLPLPPKPE